MYFEIVYLNRKYNIIGIIEDIYKFSFDRNLNFVLWRDFTVIITAEEIGQLLGGN